MFYKVHGLSESYFVILRADLYEEDSQESIKAVYEK
jgi:hypothetical protein